MKQQHWSDHGPVLLTSGKNLLFMNTPFCIWKEEGLCVYGGFSAKLSFPNYQSMEDGANDKVFQL